MTTAPEGKLAAAVELISADAIEKRIAELGAQIGAAYEGQDLVVIAVLKGSFIFAADLVRAIPNPAVQIEFLALASYGDETKSTGVVRIAADLSKPIEGKHVLVVEDIVDTGLTMTYLLENLQTRKPLSVKLCSLLHKPSRMQREVTIDYLGFTISDLFVVGYGLDYAQRYRNLPYIGVLES